MSAEENAGVLVDNRTGLPDAQVVEAVKSYFVEQASMVGANPTFQTYANSGSLLARPKFITPSNVFDEIELARELADRDDDVGATIGEMVATAYADGMENFHPDEQTVNVFNGLARNADLDAVFKAMYREYLIAGQVTTVSLFQRRTTIPVGGLGDTEQVVAPRIGILLAEQIRTIGDDLFGNADLAYIPKAGSKLEKWLTAYFDSGATAAQKAELRRLDPVSAAMFTAVVEVDNETDFIGSKTKAYRLNSRMCHRTTMPKDGPHPRPPLTRSFALLEAKRLLNLMDYALLQGAINFIVVAKVGSDIRPALQPEVDNLKEQVVRASRSGVLVGDHRIAIEIITPKLEELLNAEKRRLIGRKLAMSLLRISEQGTESPAGQGMLAEIEFISRVITSDRHDLRRHIENNVYDEAFQRNAILTKGTPRIWFPKIVLQGTNYFTDYVLKLRDRGDIPRKFGVEAAGFDWEASVEQRKRELADNIDETMAPAAVPFSSPDAGPQDNNQGRPVGTSPNNGRPNAQPGDGRDNVRPLRTINRNAGETVRAVLDEETGETRRVGERTFEILAEYADTREVGRVTPLERRALDAGEPTREGPLAIIPVNPRHEADTIKALRLAPGLSMLLGTRKGDGALIAKALCFRQPEFDLVGAEETALRWGFPIEGWKLMDELAAGPVQDETREPPPPPTIVVNQGGPTRKNVLRDQDNNIVGIVEVPIGEEDS